MASATGQPPNALEDRRATVIGSVVFCLAWATAMVGLRLWTRGVVIKQLGMDDCLCLAALLVTYGSGIAIVHMTKYGLGRHIYVMDLEHIPLYLKDFYVSIVMYCAALLFIKMAFLFQYYRVLAVQRMRNVYLSCMVIVGGWALSQVLVGIFTCHPVSGFWDSSLKATCIPNIPQWYINAAGNIITDVVVFALPMPALWSLQLARSSKVILLGIFSLGFFTVIISIIRIRYLKLFEDFPWENVDSSLWSVGELTSAITCACLPTMRPLMSRYFPGLLSSVGRTNRGYANASASAAAGMSGRRTAGAPTALESGFVGGRATRSGSKGAADDGSASMTGSEVELAQTASGGLRSNPFEVHVVHEVKMGVERGRASSPAGFGVRGYISPGSRNL
ncbi:hypothetical protein N657DRAFT_369698 [Parathielavia appendiculata]|uniref:Rhodopsin domain-containing protein n=1 Tax=Parathielavia appendiculata TaxID=2587402 RepID=A0AAN6TQ67_9PEZI|nr:hypothetical protein N657DRAFT_369698 [Parathielavia appendiculata]